MFLSDMFAYNTSMEVEVATMHEWLTLSPTIHLTMSQYELDFTISSPTGSAVLLDFSSNSRFLAVGGWEPTLHILDQLAGFDPVVSSTTPAKPTALVWESSKTFYLGLEDGRFIYYRIDLGEKRLVAGITNNFFHGAFPITAMAWMQDPRR
jgi:hypothetical protein